MVTVPAVGQFDGAGTGLAREVGTAGTTVTGAEDGLGWMVIGTAVVTG